MNSSTARWVEVFQGKLDELLPRKPNEEEFRLAVHRLIASFCEEIGSSAEISDGYTLVSGRPGSLFDRVVIVYRWPGYLNLNFDKPTDAAVGHFLGRMNRLVAEGFRRVGGVLFDGRCIVFARCVEGEWKEDYIAEVNRQTLERLLAMLLGTVPDGDRKV